MFVSMQTKSGSRDLELERDAHAEFERLFRAGRIPWHVPSWISAQDINGTLRAISWIKVSNRNGVIAETAMRQQHVGYWVHFAIRGIVPSKLQQRVRAVVNGSKSAVPLASIEERVSIFESQYKTIMALR
jgi:hypothetical protein